LLFASLSLSAFAQNRNVARAEQYLQSNDLDKARDEINPATTDEKTGNKAKTWYVKGEIYAAIAKSDKFKSLVQEPNDTAVEAFKKCLEIDPKYTGILLKGYKDLTDIYAAYYKVGADAFNNKDYKTAYTAFKNVKTLNDYLYGLNVGVGTKLDTMAVLNMSNAAYNGDNQDAAIPGYQQLADIKYKEAFVYRVLLQYYRLHNDEDKYMKVLATAKELFPDDQDIANDEISYYNSTGKTGELLKKLEQRVQQNPNDYDMVLNLAITYDNMANPKDTATGEAAPRPANYDELFNKAVETYKKAISMKPDDYSGNFNLGLMYYNAAASVGREIGQLGSSKEDEAKQEELLKKQNGFLDDAQPYLEKTYSILDAKDKLTSNELAIYKNTLSGLQGVYARKNQMDKYNDLKQKLDSADSKLEQ
jgi:tetratricopeptide (TPR) repeat protein